MRTRRGLRVVPRKKRSIYSTLNWQFLLVYTLTYKHNTSLKLRSPCANPDGPLKDGSHQAGSLSQWMCGCRPSCVSGWGRDLCVWHLFLYVLWTERPCVCMPVCWPWARLKQQTLLLLNDPENQCVRVRKCVCIWERERESTERNIRAAFKLLAFRETFSMSQGCGKLPTVTRRVNRFTFLSRCNVYNTV